MTFRKTDRRLYPLLYPGTFEGKANLGLQKSIRSRQSMKESCSGSHAGKQGHRVVLKLRKIRSRAIP